MSAETTTTTRAPRAASVERLTKETHLVAALGLDPARPGAERVRRIDVPSGFFGHMLDALATHAAWDLELTARGDTHVDLHHTVEDTGIALGDAFHQALGQRLGIVRFAHAYAPLDEALARAVVDLSGRGYFVYDAPPAIAASWVTPEFPLTLMVDFFHALADRGRLTLHLAILAARNPHHAAEAAFKAAALALREAARVRAAAAADAPSTKGTLTS